MNYQQIKDEYKELLNDSNLIKIGPYSYEQGNVLLAVDPIAFNKDANNYCDAEYTQVGDGEYERKELL